MSKNAAVDNYILNIIRNENIHEQADLQARLKERGCDMPQATLSRHLKRLKIAKVDGVYCIVEMNTSSISAVLNVQVAESGLIVLHTHPGCASGLAYFFDQKFVAYSPRKNNSSCILGTIAGDDTVLLILRSRKDVSRVLTILEESFPYLGKLT